MINKRYLEHIHLVTDPLGIVEVGDIYQRPSEHGHYCIVPFVITEVAPNRSWAKYKIPAGKAHGELRRETIEREGFIGTILKVRPEGGLEQHVDPEQYRRLTGQETRRVSRQHPPAAWKGSSASALDD